MGGSVSVIRAWAAICLIALAGHGDPACAAPKHAKDQSTAIDVLAGTKDSPSHALARQFSESIFFASNGAFTLDVGVSQGTVANIKEAALRRGNYVFTAMPSVIAQAQKGAKPFAPNRHYRDIRSLFPIPFSTLHWVVRQDSDIKTMADFAGHSLAPGPQGTVSERVSAAALQALGLADKVQIFDLDPAGAAAALRDSKVNVLALAGTEPLDAVEKLAQATPLRLIGLSPDERQKLIAEDDRLVPDTIPKGTYAGVDTDVASVALPSGAYTTVRMDDATAYAITKIFWAQHAALVQKNAAWQSVTPTELPMLAVKLHKGALKYYDEAGIEVPAALR